RLRRLDCVALDSNHRELDAKVIADAHAAGFKVLCYTVNDRSRAQDLLSWGLDGLITDAVDQIEPQP
ncbi:glycerophosphodiester phosphodiesterase family protein, partial [Cupriavidus sp. CER94]|uniref:glycerophosphodiester phosphodiesterase family protein n=1 Tax=Cupriavidus sp. CER94 TaxID=3377036 RepID=UPI00381936DD